MSDTVQQIKDRLSIVDVVSQYVKLERAGSILRARCPFHAERTPSFIVSPERGTYHCFGCGVGGDIFSFTEAIEGLDFKGALKVLADKAGVEIVYERGSREHKDERDRLLELMEAATIFYSSKMDDTAKKYLKDRGVTAGTVKEFRLGWAGNGWSDFVDYIEGKSAQGGSASGRKFTEKEIIEAGMAKKNERGSLVDKFRNRIMFPIADSAGRIVAFSGRSFGAHASPDAPKYLNSPETPLFHKSRILYGFDKAKVSIRKHNCAVLVEGQMDLLASHQSGWGNTVAVSGTAFTSEHATLIKRMTENLVIALDADPAGIKAAGKAARAAMQSGLNVKVASLPSGLDPADLVLQQGKDAWSAAIRDSKDIISFLLDVLEEHAKEKDAFRRSVEQVVLPFLSDVGSPIAREQYIRRVAGRLGVSEQAVEDAVLRLPAQATTPLPPNQFGADAHKSIRKGSGPTRASQAFSILLWQRSLPKPSLDIAAYEANLKEALGEGVLRTLEDLSRSEQERLRFSAELLYGKVNLESEAQALTSLIVRERLGEELSEATRALKRAESAGDEAEIERLMAHCVLLTRRIAQMHAPV